MNICRPATPKTNGKTERVNCVPEASRLSYPKWGLFQFTCCVWIDNLPEKEKKIMSRFTIAAIQIDTQDDKRENLGKAGKLIDEAAKHGARMIALPENVDFIGKKEGALSNAESIPGPTTEFFSEKAREHKIWLHCGSIGERIPGEQKLYNTSLLMNPSGEIVGRYEKIHLYDVAIQNGPSTRESDTRKPGKDIAVCDTEFCKVGLSICYDMRFPELYRIMALRGALIMFVPANYTLFTGKDHWEPILRTRAIENQCYVVAPAQIGKKPAFQAYGRSMVINPWGTVIATAEDRECVVYATIDTDYVEAIRTQLPSLPNRRPEAYRW